MKLKRIYKQALSTLLLGVYLTTQAGNLSAYGFTSVGGQTGSGTEQEINILRELPMDMGVITAQATGSGPNPFVLHIQDAHANPSAQAQIARILEWIGSKTGRKVFIGLEGAEGSLRPEFLNYSDRYPEVNKMIANELLKAGELTGAEMAAWQLSLKSKKKNNPEFYGIETPALYAKNYALYRKVVRRAEQNNAALDQLRTQLELIASKNLSPELRAFLIEKKKRREGQYGSALQSPQLETYLKYLQEQAFSRLKIDLNDSFEQVRFPEIVRYVQIHKSFGNMDISKAKQQAHDLNTELRSQIKDEENSKMFNELAKLDQAVNPRGLMENVWKTALKTGINLQKYPEFLRYAGFLILSSEMDAASLFEEMDRLEKDLMLQMIQTVKEKNILALYEGLQHIENLVCLEMQNNGASMARALQPNVYSLVQELAVLGANLDFSSPAWFILQSAIRDASEFYRTVKRRDETLLNNALKSADPDSVIVLIAGGFHTEGLQSEMEKQGVGYAVVRPRFKFDAGENLYAQVMQNTDLNHEDDLFGGHKKMFSPQQKIILKPLLEKAPQILRDAYHLDDPMISAEITKIMAAHPLLSNGIVSKSDLTASPMGAGSQAGKRVQGSADSLVKALLLGNHPDRLLGVQLSQRFVLSGSQVQLVSRGKSVYASLAEWRVEEKPFHVAGRSELRTDGESSKNYLSQLFSEFGEMKAAAEKYLDVYKDLSQLASKDPSLELTRARIMQIIQRILKGEIILTGSKVAVAKSTGPETYDIIGQLDYALVHFPYRGKDETGFLHPTVEVFVTSPLGNLVLTRRVDNELLTIPGGHMRFIDPPSSGFGAYFGPTPESEVQAALRHLNQDLGLREGMIRADELKPIGALYRAPLTDRSFNNEIKRVFHVRLPINAWLAMLNEQKRLRGLRQAIESETAKRIQAYQEQKEAAEAPAEIEPQAFRVQVKAEMNTRGHSILGKLGDVLEIAEEDREHYLQLAEPVVQSSAGVKDQFVGAHDVLQLLLTKSAIINYLYKIESPIRDLQLLAEKDPALGLTAKAIEGLVRRAEPDYKGSDKINLTGERVTLRRIQQNDDEGEELGDLDLGFVFALQLPNNIVFDTADVFILTDHPFDGRIVTLLRTHNAPKEPKKVGIVGGYRHSGETLEATVLRKMSLKAGLEEFELDSQRLSRLGMLRAQNKRQYLYVYSATREESWQVLKKYEELMNRKRQMSLADYEKWIESVQSVRRGEGDVWSLELMDFERFLSGNYFQKDVFRDGAQEYASGPTEDLLAPALKEHPEMMLVLIKKALRKVVRAFEQEPTLQRVENLRSLIYEYAKLAGEQPAEVEKTAQALRDQLGDYGFRYMMGEKVMEEGQRIPIAPLPVRTRTWLQQIEQAGLELQEPEDQISPRLPVLNYKVSGGAEFQAALSYKFREIDLRTLDQAESSEEKRIALTELLETATALIETFAPDFKNELKPDQVLLLENIRKTGLEMERFDLLLTGSYFGLEDVPEDSILASVIWHYLDHQPFRKKNFTQEQVEQALKTLLIRLQQTVQGSSISQIRKMREQYQASLNQEARSEIRSFNLTREKLLTLGQRYVEILSSYQNLGLNQNPDVFFVMGGPDLKAYAAFAKRWLSTYPETPIMIAGGIGRGTPPLARRIFDYYKSRNRLTVEDEATLQTAMSQENKTVFETHLIALMLQKEGVPANMIHFEEGHSSVTYENFKFSLNPISQLLGAKENPVVAIVHSPPLLLRAHATSMKQWESKIAGPENPKGWVIKTFKPYHLRLNLLSDEELIERMGYIAGYPRIYADKFMNKAGTKSELNLGNELAGSQVENNPHLVSAVVPLDAWILLKDIQSAFFEFIRSEPVLFDETEKKLVPVRNRVRESIASGDADKFALFINKYFQILSDQKLNPGVLSQLIFEVTRDQADLRNRVSAFYKIYSEAQNDEHYRLPFQVLTNLGIGEIVYITPEMFGISEGGGLAHVAKFENEMLARNGVPVSIVTLLYEQSQGKKHKSAEQILKDGIEILGKPVPVKEIGEVELLLGPTVIAGTRNPIKPQETVKAKVYLAENQGMKVYLLRNERYADLLYNPQVTDSEEQIRRALFLSRASLEVIRQFGLRPGSIISNDWYAAPAPILLETDPRYSANEFLKNVPRGHVFHNLGNAYQGNFKTNDPQKHWGREVYADLFPLFGVDGMHYDGFKRPGQNEDINLTAGAIYHVNPNRGDFLLAVSQPYARQLLSGQDEDARVLQGHLNWKQSRVFGISNGIDFNYIRNKYYQIAGLPHAETEAEFIEKLPARKTEMKLAFQKQYGLDENPKAVLISLMGRLAEQKGIKLLTDSIQDPSGEKITVLERMLRINPDIQIFIGGPPSPNDVNSNYLMEVVNRLKADGRYQGRIHGEFRFLAYDEALKVEIASNLFLMPSRYEPGGLTQLESLLLGTPIVARNVGGIAATVVNYNPETGIGDSFLFNEYTGGALFSAVLTAYQTIQDPAKQQSLTTQAAKAQNDWNDRLYLVRALLQDAAGITRYNYPHLSNIHDALNEIRTHRSEIRMPDLSFATEEAKREVSEWLKENPVSNSRLRSEVREISYKVTAGIFPKLADLEAVYQLDRDSIAASLFRELTTGEVQDLILDKPSTAQAAQQALGPYAWFWDSLQANQVQKKPIQLLIMEGDLAKGEITNDLDPEQYSGLLSILAISSDKRDKIFLVSSRNESQRKQIETDIENLAIQKFGLPESVKHKIQVVASLEAGTGDWMQALHLQPGQTAGILSDSTAFLQNMGYRSESIRMSSENIPHAVSAMIAAALLREQFDQDGSLAYDVVKLYQWLNQHGVQDVQDFARHIGQMIDALQHIATQA